ncbi:bacterioferritin [Xanthomonas oryzae pv. oryzae]|nr:bacterioferritin [Xanthomonas oryzae pv. oryzae]
MARGWRLSANCCATSAAENGCASLSELTMRTGCGSNCGSCLEMAGDLLNQVHPTRALPLPLLGVGQRCLM